MVKCRDGRKHIMVKEYKKKDGTKVPRHECGCPTYESSISENLYICHVCRKEYTSENIHRIEINGKIQNICKNCANTFHVLA